MFIRGIVVLSTFLFVLFTPIMAKGHEGKHKGSSHKDEKYYCPKKHGIKNHEWRHHKPHPGKHHKPHHPKRHKPYADCQSITTLEETAKEITLTGFDKDSDTLSFIVSKQPSHGTLQGMAPNLTYTPEPYYSGDDSFLFQADDGNFTSRPAIVKIKIIPVNDYPTVNLGQDLTMSIGESIVIDGSSCTSGKKKRELTYQWEQDGVILSNQKRFKYEAMKLGDFTLRLIVTNRKGRTRSDEMIVHVLEANNATPTNYQDTFAIPDAPISDVTNMVINEDIARLDEKTEELIKKAERIIAKKKYTLDVPEMTAEEKEKIETRKTQIQEELNKYEN